MSDFSIKDIPQLGQTLSLDGEMKLAVAVPSTGTDHNLRYIEKYDLFRYNQTSVPTRQTFTGVARIINVNGEASYLEFIQPASALVARGISILGVSPDGASIPARLEVDGTVAGQTLKLFNGGVSFDISYGGATDQTATVVESGVLQVNPKVFKSEPTTGNTINVDNAQHAVQYIVPAGALAALTINMPNAATNGRRVSFYFEEDITTVTHNGTSGATIKSPITTASAGDRVTYVFFEADNVWLPIS